MDADEEVDWEDALVIAQVGLSFDLGPLFAAVIIIAVAIVCLVLDLAALLGTQAKIPQTAFAIMAGALSLGTGVVCVAWSAVEFELWSSITLFPAFATLFGALTIAAGFYMRRRIDREARMNG